MPAPRPKRVRIGPYDFTIDWMPIVMLEDGRALDGYSKLSDLRIVVRTDMAAPQERATLLHEVLHMCIGVSGWENALSNGLVKRDYVEEAVVRALEAPLLGVLLQNPKLLTYLLDRG